MKFVRLIILWGVLLRFTSWNMAFAQGTAFTYQGHLLVNSTSAAGTYDLQFKLHPSATSTNVIGSPLTNATVPVTNGLFVVTLDFGNVYSASPLYLEIGVRTNGSAAPYTILSPTTLITSAPYAVQALNAATAATYAGTVADSQLSTNIPRLDSSLVFPDAISFSNASGIFNGTFNGAVAGTFSGTGSGAFTGNGAGLTNLNVTNLIGIVQSNPNWQLIQATSQQGVAANNYLTTNAAQTTLILPANPSVGTTLQIAGSGANGWVLSQNSGQSILTTGLGFSAGQTWSPVATSQAWHAVAASASGLTLAAAYNTGYIYYSPDGGQTWIKSDAPSEPWTGLASSSDGTHMVAVCNGGYIYTSVNSGTNWSQQTGSTYNYYRGVASSANGINLVAVAGSGVNPVYLSSNGGTNWSAAPNLTSQNWSGVACSADGTKIAAVSGSYTPVYISQNAGQTWTNGNVTNYWTAISSSSDGAQLLAAASTGYLYTSGNYGLSWTPRASSQAWTCVASSANGLNLAAAYSLGYLYTSSDGGQTWLQRANGYSGALAWTALCASSSGSRLLAAVSTGQLYVSVAATTVGTTGYLAGSQYSSMQLQYVGNGQWLPLIFNGTFSGF